MALSNALEPICPLLGWEDSNGGLESIDAWDTEACPFTAEGMTPDNGSTGGGAMPWKL